MSVCTTLQSPLNPIENAKLTAHSQKQSHKTKSQSGTEGHGRNAQTKEIHKSTSIHQSIQHANHVVEDLSGQGLTSMHSHMRGCVFVVVLVDSSGLHSEGQTQPYHYKDFEHMVLHRKKTKKVRTPE